MTGETHQKVRSCHLKRNAYLYVRQSTLRQVFENAESTKRQYALKQQAIALGWEMDRIVVIDSDQGQSGSSATDRKGFQHLVSEVGLGRAGLVMGLEVSRLARNSMDWHRLLEICALTETLILDEDGVYDPAHFNDRLLLGLKGTMSEAELHILRARLQGGIRNKARRGDLRVPLPMGLVYAPDGQVVLDPDRQVQQVVRLLFDTYNRTGAAMATVKSFRQQGLLFPRRPRMGLHKGEVVWAPLVHSQVLRILKNPRYAGAFVFGRSRMRKTLEGDHRVKRLPREEWHTLIPGAHMGYIRWEEYEANLHRLSQNAQSYATDRHQCPPREGPALLQGLLLCGICGRRMSLRYHVRSGRLYPDYVCQRERVELAAPQCQAVPGAGIDEAVGKLLIEAFTPVALEVSLAVHDEMQARVQESDRSRRTQVERARYEAELARQRFMCVHPEHRLVADSLEADWNEKLRALTAAQEDYERRCQQDRRLLGDAQRSDILALAGDFPRLWNDPRTPDRERKRMIRLLIEDVTLIRGQEITLHVRFKAGATQTLKVPVPLAHWQLQVTNPEVIGEIDRLLDQHTDGQVANTLNQSSKRSGTGKAFTRVMVARLRRDYHLRSRQQRLRESGLLTSLEMSKLLGITPYHVREWHRAGLIRGHAYNDKNECLYEHPGTHRPHKMQGVKLSLRRPFPEVVTDGHTEVQCGV